PAIQAGLSHSVGTFCAASASPARSTPCSSRDSIAGIDWRSWLPRSDILRISCLQRRTGMQVVLARWGNSLGVRIPKDIASRAGLSEGTRVEIEADGDRIVIT